jgi:hypothetical protein
MKPLKYIFEIFIYTLIKFKKDKIKVTFILFIRLINHNASFYYFLN